MTAGVAFIFPLPADNIQIPPRLQYLPAASKPMNKKKEGNEVTKRAPIKPMNKKRRGQGVMKRDALQIGRQVKAG